MSSVNNTVAIESENPDKDEEAPNELLIDVVCFTCPYLFRCGPRAEHNPIDCVWLKDWINDSLIIYEQDFEYDDD